MNSTRSLVHPLPVFDCRAFGAALDEHRRAHGMNWIELADVLWQQSAELNARRSDHPLCPGAVGRLVEREAVSCQYALFMLRWMRRPPEDFLTGTVVEVGATSLPEAGKDRRLRWTLPQVHTALDRRRREYALTWTALAGELDCAPNRLTNLRTARLADLGLAVRATQWLGQPAAVFIHPAEW